MTANGDTARTFGDRYVLGDRITAGETREVWHAHDDIVSRQVALKIFFGAPATDPAWRERFRRDADRLVALSHPGIAKVYDHDESEDEAWLAMAFVSGQPLTERLADSSLDVATALDIVGQTAFAVQAAHDVGIAHGAIGPASIMIRPDGVVSLIGFAVAGGASQADDLRALGALTRQSLSGPAVSTPGLPPDVEHFMGWVTDPGRSNPPRDAGEIGRTALALATSLRSGAPASVVPPASKPRTDPTDAEPRYDDAERKQVRNRLIVLGTIVVVGGAALLRFIGESGGQVTVPSVVGLPVNQAQLQLTKDGLRSSSPQCVVGKDSGGTVVSQLPLVGASVKAGSAVVISYAQAVCP
jgi:hypothetical protein